MYMDNLFEENWKRVLGKVCEATEIQCSIEMQ